MLAYKTVFPMLIPCLFLAASSLDGLTTSIGKNTCDVEHLSYERLLSAREHFKNGDPALALQLVTAAMGKLEFRHRPNALFLMGESQFQMGEWDLAAAQFLRVVALERGGDFLEPSLNYLWLIAEKYRAGERHHLLGYANLPRWSKERGPCLPLYNEIAEIVPFGELAEKALLAKGLYLRESSDFGHSNEALNALIAGFPGGLRAAQSYVLIGQNLVDLMRLSPGDEELLSSALSNYERCRVSFPDHAQELLIAKEQIEEMRSLLADQLVVTGQFYERKKELSAARVYYDRVAERFSQTPALSKAQKRLSELNKRS